MIFEGTWHRSLDVWCERIATEYLPTDQVDLWLFDDEASRRAAQRHMAAQGFHVRVHSALKPLVHFFRDLSSQPAYTHIRIAYPVSPHAVENRFKLEAYPLAALLQNATFLPKPPEACDQALYYDVTLTLGDRTEHTHRVFCPNRRITDWGGLEALTPCGWLRVARAGSVIADHAIATEFEQLFADTMTAIDALALPESTPWFEELRLDICLPHRETPLGYGDEVVSFQEALHEEFYFSLLELFQRKAGLTSGDRSIQPGQIAPFIRFDEHADCRVQVRAQALCRDDEATPHTPCAAAPLPHTQIHDALAHIGGQPLFASSRSGRPVAARYISGSDQAVLISACQHGNETTGTAGALQAAMVLKNKDGAHFVISPLENPDGNALFLRLLQDNPQHMHHAARYTAYGNDLQATPDHAPAEREIRILGQQRSQAQLHVNLHGYPSHEWIRPLSGYIPRNFAMWTLPKGFFLVFRHQTGFEDLARQLAQRVTQALGNIPALVRLNRQQIALYRQHAGHLEFEVIHDVACSFSCSPDARFAVELVSEFPDETIAGAAFRLGAQVQQATVLAAYDAWQTLYPRRVTS